MLDHEMESFNNAWLPAQELAGKEPSDGAVILAFKLLEKYSLADINNGLVAHLTDPVLGKFAPKPADVIFQIERANHDGRLGADEAWSIAIRFFDDNQTVVINDEISGSVELAQQIYNDGDKTGARMAFRASYERNVDQARKDGKPVKWFASLGDDISGRQAPLEQAAVSGLLPTSYVDQFLIAPMAPNLLALIKENAPQVELIGAVEE
ncbi:MAG: hypothetical protein ACJAVY_001332 [Marinoscillum sp.]|jgi:hypothetical protein